MDLIKYFIILILLIFVLESCYKDEVIIDDTKTTLIEHPDSPASGDVIGLIRDEFGNALEESSSELPNQHFESNEEGIYHFSVSNVNLYDTPLSISNDKQDFYFNIQALDGEVSYFEHCIFTQTTKTQKASTEKIDLSLEESVNISIQNSSTLLNGVNYEGEYILSAFVPDLNNPLEFPVLPGHLALDNDNLSWWLNFAQVIHLSIMSENGEPLTLVEGKGSIDFEGTGIEDHDIWKYDNDKRKWIIHTLAEQRNGNKFTIDSGGFYAIAKAHSYNNVYGQVLLEDNPLPNLTIEIYSGEQLVEKCRTTNSGKWFCQLPIYSFYNYKVRFEEIILFEGYFDTKNREIALPSVVLNDKSIKSLNITVDVRDCQDQLTEEYFIKSEQEGQKSYYFRNVISDNLTILLESSSNVLLNTYDKWLENKSPSISYSSLDENIELNRSYVCNDFREGYFRISIDGNNRIFTVMESRHNEGETSLMVYDEINLISEFHISFSGNEPRYYQDNELKIYFDQVEIEGIKYEIDCLNSDSGCGFKTFEILHYAENKGGWIQGSFKGEFWVKTLDPLQATFKEISGIFLVPRTFS